MDKEVLDKIKEQEKRIEVVEKSVGKIRKYLFWRLIITIIIIVLPIIGISFIIPEIINMFGEISNN